MNIANFITITRILLVPIIIWLIITNEMLLAFITFLIAGISDAFDGFIAKQFNQTTELGAYLDPIADKAMLVSIYISLGMLEYIPSLLVILVVSRDLLIIGAVVLALVIAMPLQARPLMISKLNTTLQIILALVILGQEGLNIDYDEHKIFLFFLVGTSTVVSGGVYLKEWIRHVSQN